MLILGSSEEVELEEVEAALSTHTAGLADTQAGVEHDASVYGMPLREAREQFERDYLLHQLQACGGSVGKLASLAGMERTNLYRKLRALGIDVKQALK
jgi:DNA-binding NtrC family response regulator